MSGSSKVYKGKDVQKHGGIKAIFDSSTKHLLKKISQVKVPHNDTDQYDFSHPVRGLGIIIGNKKFNNVKCYQERVVADKEIEHMSKVFSYLNFHVVKFKNLKAEQMREVMSVAASYHEVNNHADAFAFAIGSHGEEVETEKASDKTTATGQPRKFYHFVNGTDGPIATNELVSLFDKKNCKSLSGKPKLFFIQACRSRGNDTQLDKGIEIGKDSESSITIDHNDAKRTEEPKQYHTGTKRKEEPKLDHTDAKMELPKQDHTDANMELPKQDHTDANMELPKQDHSDANLEVPIQDHPDTKMEVSTQDRTNANLGDHTDAIVELPKQDHTEAKRMEAAKQDHTDAKKQEEEKERESIYMPSCPNDCLIMMATTEGNYAYRRGGEGGWLLSVLRKVVDSKIDDISRTEFLELMTEVCGQIALDYRVDISGTKWADCKDCKAAATIEHRLMKDIYFTN